MIQNDSLRYHPIDKTFKKVHRMMKANPLEAKMPL